MRAVTRNRWIFGIALLIGLWLFGLSLIGYVLLAVVAYFAWEWLAPIVAEHRRENRLRARYSGQTLNDLIGKVIWEGETAEQVRDSLGPPVEIETQARKTKHKEVWKYGHEGGNRFRLRITLDDGQVVGWKLRD